MKMYLIAALSLTLAGCAASGPKIDAPRLSELRKGETTVTQVVKSFGRPSVLSKNMDGTQTAIYMHVEGRSDAASFVSLVGAMAGNADANVDSVIFQFDEKGVLTGYKTTQAAARKPEVAQAERSTSTPATSEPVTQADTKKQPARSEKKPRPVDSDPWTIQLYPSGYRENR